MVQCRGGCNKFQDAGSVHVAGQAPHCFQIWEPRGSVECVECKCELLTACDLGDCREEGANMGKTGYTARGREEGSTELAQSAVGIALPCAGRLHFSRKSLACSALISAVLIGSAAVAAGTHAGNQAEVPCDLLSACNNPTTCPALSEDPPAMFSVRFETTAGEFTVTTVTAWAPPYAARFWQLARVGYMLGAPFYRVDRINSSMAWVVQFGYRGEPAVDKCWDEKRTSNQTWSVSRPGNVRGTMAFSMNAVAPSPDMVNCTSDLYCAQGFSTNIFINYADNVRLDSPGFSVFGYVEAGGMRVVDKLFAGYGEVSELCQGDDNSTRKSAAGTSFCNGFGAACKGVSMSRLLDQGQSYWQTERPLLDSILGISIVSISRVRGQALDEWLGYDDRKDADGGGGEVLRLRSGKLPWNNPAVASDDLPVLVTTN